MSNENELGRLEDFVAKLLDKYNGMLAEKTRVEQALEESEAKIAALESNLLSLKDERGEISSRVSGLLTRIEEWEDSLDQAEPEGEGEKEDGDEGAEQDGDIGVQGNLFSADSQEEEQQEA
ncbi:MAG: hypothetical protein ABFS19_03745 [Thermodesulfobacteriota bacterium]